MKDNGQEKGGGSSRNGRDSQSQRLGIKEYAGERVTAGSILVRQRGTKIHPGLNVGVGPDYTLYAKVEGLVSYERRGRKGTQVSVYPEAMESV